MEANIPPIPKAGCRKYFLVQKLVGFNTNFIKLKTFCHGLYSCVRDPDFKKITPVPKRPVSKAHKSMEIKMHALLTSTLNGASGTHLIGDRVCTKTFGRGA
jgi:hypothetical protein